MGQRRRETEKKRNYHFSTHKKTKGRPALSQKSPFAAFSPSPCFEFALSTFSKTPTSHKTPVFTNAFLFLPTCFFLLVQKGEANHKQTKNIEERKRSSFFFPFSLIFEKKTKLSTLLLDLFLSVLFQQNGCYRGRRGACRC